MSYRNDLDALAARHAALEAELAQKTKELDQAARLLADAQAKSKLPVLDNIRVASPCSAAWSGMTGDERVRHCGDCKKNVYNLSEMTRDEAEALIVEKEGRLCVRYYQRADGTILLKDCVVGARRKRRRRIVAAGAAAMLAGGAALYAKLAGDDAKPSEDVEAYAGELVIETPPPAPPPPEVQPAQVEEREELEVVMGDFVRVPADDRARGKSQ